MANGIEAHLDRLKAEVIRLKGGELRHAIMRPHGRWEDCTNEAIHEERNLIAVLEVMQRPAIEQRELLECPKSHLE